MDEIKWNYVAGNECVVCKDGLCQRLNQLMEDGYSQRGAARVMSEESDGKFKTESIRNMFRYAMGEIHPKEEATAKKETGEQIKVDLIVPQAKVRPLEDTTIYDLMEVNAYLKLPDTSPQKEKERQPETLTIEIDKIKSSSTRGESKVTVLYDKLLGLQDFITKEIGKKDRQEIRQTKFHKNEKGTRWISYDEDTPLHGCNQKTVN